MRDFARISVANVCPSENQDSFYKGHGCEGIFLELADTVFSHAEGNWKHRPWSKNKSHIVGRPSVKEYL